MQISKFLLMPTLQACLGLKSLRTLNASFCKSLRKPEFSGTYLKSVKLQGCIGLTNVNVEKCPQLQILDVRGCLRLKNENVIYTSEVCHCECLSPPVGLCD